MAEFWIGLAWLVAGCSLGILAMCLMFVASESGRDQDTLPGHDEVRAETAEASTESRAPDTATAL